MEGRVEGLYLGPEDEGPIESLTEVTAVAGKGLEGDRYFGSGDETEEITLFTAEALRRVNAETDLNVDPEDMRRNVMTSGIDLTQLIGKRFRVGAVEVEALADNPPCKHLQKLAGKPLLKPLIKEGGVRGRIVGNGTIKVGDAIRVSD